MRAPARKIAAAAAGVAAVAAIAVGGATSADGTFSTAAGTGQRGFAGDGGPAPQALLDTPRDVASDAGGGILIADTNNDRIRRIQPNGRIDTVAGTGNPDFCCDGDPATSADLDHPQGVTAMPGGGFLIADTGSQRVRRVFPDGTIRTVAGNGAQGDTGDGGPATSAKLNHPIDTTVESDGTILIADSGNDAVRQVTPGGTISTVAGSGLPGFAGDGGPAVAARLSDPHDVAVASNGGFLVADTGNSRIRRVAPDGSIDTVAGNGVAGYSGHGDPAVQSSLDHPSSVIALPHGAFLLADTANNRVRRVTPMGTIFTVAGTGPAGHGGAGGPASQAQLNSPDAVTLASGGGFLVADTGNQQVDRSTDVGQIPDPVIRHSIGIAPVNGNVMVRPRGAPDFIPLQEQDLVPDGSRYNATAGRVKLSLNEGSDGVLPSEFYEGSFITKQGAGSRPITDVSLIDRLACSSTARASRHGPLAIAARSPRARAARRRRRHLWAKARRHVRVRGSRATAGVRDPLWEVEDTCTTTRIVVRQGQVIVRDLVKHRTLTLHAGHQYTARARKR